MIIVKKLSALLLVFFMIVALAPNLAKANELEETVQTDNPTVEVELPTETDASSLPEEEHVDPTLLIETQDEEVNESELEVIVPTEELPVEELEPEVPLEVVEEPAPEVEVVEPELEPEPEPEVEPLMVEEPPMMEIQAEPLPILVIKNGVEETTYATLEEAFAFVDLAENAGSTFEVVVSGDASTSTYRVLDGLNVTVRPAEGTKPTLNLAPLVLKNGTYKFSSFVINMTPLAGDQYGSAGNPDNPTTLRIGDTTNGNATVTFDNVALTLDGNNTTHAHALYIQGAPGTNQTVNFVNNSTVLIQNYAGGGSNGNGISTESESIKYINVVDSTLVTTNNRTGIVSGSGPTYVTVSGDGARFDAISNRGNGSNGGHFTAENGGTFNFNNNGSHGLSVTTLTVDGGYVNANNNGIQGIHVTGPLTMTNGAEVVASGNLASSGNSAGMYLGVANHYIDASSSLTLTGNSGPGLHVNGGAGDPRTLTIEEGAFVHITGNKAEGTDTYTRGGGVYLRGNVSAYFPDNSAIYNNTAPTAGDDIFASEGSSIRFGATSSTWIVLGESVDGWFEDPEGNRWRIETPVESSYVDLYDEFGNFVAGELALKATYTLQVPITANKVWVNGPIDGVQTYLKLYRHIIFESVAQEAVEVPGAIDMSLAPGVDEATWIDQDQFDPEANVYYYSVKEVTAEGLDYVPDHYTKVEEGLTVTNSYVVPKGEITATKVWSMDLNLDLLSSYNCMLVKKLLVIQ